MSSRFILILLQELKKILMDIVLSDPLNIQEYIVQSLSICMLSVISIAIAS